MTIGASQRQKAKDRLMEIDAAIASKPRPAKGAFVQEKEKIAAKLENRK